MKNPIYTYRGIHYEILSHITDSDDKGRANQLLRDFLHCEEIGDWGTIKNRINNGLMWGWLRKLTDGELASGVREISFKEDSDIVQNVDGEVELKGELNEKGFW